MLAFTFPGQGSQRSGMGRPWVEHPSWEVTAEASDIAGRDLTDLLLEAPMEELTLTGNAQLATFVMSLVVLDAVERLGLFPAGDVGRFGGDLPRGVLDPGVAHPGSLRSLSWEGKGQHLPTPFDSVRNWWWGRVGPAITMAGQVWHGSRRCR